VIFGYQSEQQIDAKITRAAHAVGLPPGSSIHVFMYDMRGCAPWNNAEQAAWAKPSPAMILEVMAKHNARPSETTM